MGKLEDLRVERVDGVDRPATGHHFVIVKSEGGAAPTPAQLIDELEKAESLSDEQRELLTKLKASIVKDEGDEADTDGDESDETDESDEADEDETDDEDDPEADDRPADDPGRTLKAELEALLATDDGKAVIKTVLDSIVKEELADDGDKAETVEKAEAPATKLRSRQPSEQTVEKAEKRTVAKGEGMFSNIIFGQGRN